MPWARASSLDRHLACAAASVLPRLDRGAWSPPYLEHGWHGGNSKHLPSPPPDDKTLAEWGTRLHLAKSDPSRASDPWLSWMEPHRERYWPAELGQHEVTAAYNCRTSEVEEGPVNAETEVADAWKASRSADCVVGTLDWLAVLPSGEPWVDDLKTGWPTPDPLSGQMLFAALVATTLHKAKTCRVSVTHWRRGESEPTRAGLWRHVGPVTLDAFKAELREAWARATGANPYPVPGPHCKYCPSALVCPRAND